MNELPDPAPRALIHRRRIVAEGFLRQDGLWDLEAELLDTKTHPFVTAEGRLRAPGEAAHHMRIRLTVDTAFTIHGAVATMPSTPFAECQPAAQSLEGLLGARIGPGWRAVVHGAMGGVRGCTHLREMLNVIATLAFQTIGPYQNQQARDRGIDPVAGATRPMYAMGQCLAWDFDGAVVARVAPQFIGWRKPGKGDPGG